MKLRYIPNIITLARILLVWPFVANLLYGQYTLAFYIFIVAGFSDGVDGFLARRFGWTSELGSFMDPLADKLLMIVSFMGLAFLGVMPIWVALLIIARDIVIMAGVGGLLYVFNKVEFKPTLISKLNTLMQILLVVTLLFELAYWSLPKWLMLIMISITVITTVATFIDYVWTWACKAYADSKGIKP